MPAVKDYIYFDSSVEQSQILHRRERPRHQTEPFSPLRHQTNLQYEFLVRLAEVLPCDVSAMTGT